MGTVCQINYVQDSSSPRFPHIFFPLLRIHLVLNLLSLGVRPADCGSPSALSLPRAWHKGTLPGRLCLSLLAGLLWFPDWTFKHGASGQTFFLFPPTHRWDTRLLSCFDTCAVEPLACQCISSLPHVVLFSEVTASLTAGNGAMAIRYEKAGSFL